MGIVGRTRVLALVVALAFAAAPAFAESVSLDALLGGQTLTVGDKLFSDFDIIEGGTCLLDVDCFTGLALTVNGTTDTGGNVAIELAGTIELNNILSNQFNTYDVRLLYKVSVLDPALAIVGVTQKVVGSISQAGDFFSVDELAEGMPIGNTAFSSVSPGDLTDPPAEIALFDDLVLDPTAMVFITKDISLSAVPGGRVNISSITQGFPQEEIPEPTTMLLFSSALLGLGVVRRLRKS